MRTRAHIGHIDADCFYVSAERVRFPHLRGKPVGVLGNQGACVIAKSYELKACGVATGTPVWDAHRLCPEAIYVKRDFRWYEVLSRRLLEHVRRISPAVEYYSIDELFFDASHLPRAFGTDMRTAAASLQRRILRDTGVPVTIGIAETKLLAKLASDTAKPFGCAVALTRDERARLLRGKPVSDITGIAGRRAKTLADRSIYTCDQFVVANRTLIRQLLTKHGEDMWWELSGVPVLRLQTERPPHKVVARGGSVGVATADRPWVEGWLIRNVERLVDALEHHGYVTDRLGLFLGFKDGGGSYGRVDLPGAAAAFEELAPAARSLLERGWTEGRKVHYMHVIAERLQFAGRAQRSLFATDPTRPTLSQVIRRVNAEVGRFAVRSAATLPLHDVYADRANDYDICDVYGKSCF